MCMYVYLYCIFVLYSYIVIMYAVCMFVVQYKRIAVDKYFNHMSVNQSINQLINQSINKNAFMQT